MKELNMTTEKLWWYLESRKFGTVPHLSLIHILFLENMISNRKNPFSATVQINADKKSLEFIYPLSLIHISKIKEACKCLDLVLLDHIILTDEHYYSFTDEGLI